MYWVYIVETTYMQKESEELNIYTSQEYEASSK